MQGSSAQRLNRECCASFPLFGFGRPVRKQVSGFLLASDSIIEDGGHQRNSRRSGGVCAIWFATRHGRGCSPRARDGSRPQDPTEFRERQRPETATSFRRPPRLSEPTHFVGPAILPGSQILLSRPSPAGPTSRSGCNPSETLPDNKILCCHCRRSGLVGARLQPEFCGAAVPASRADGGVAESLVSRRPERAGLLHSVPRGTGSLMRGR